MITRADLETMTPEQINTAREAGTLDHLLRGDDVPDPAAGLANLTDHQVNTMREQGLLGHLLNPPGE